MTLSQLRSCMRASASHRLVCADDEEHVPSHEHIGRSADGSVGGGDYDRQGSIVCKPLEIARGEVLTVVSFSTVRP